MRYRDLFDLVLEMAGAPGAAAGGAADLVDNPDIAVAVAADTGGVRAGTHDDGRLAGPQEER